MSYDYAKSMIDADI